MGHLQNERVDVETSEVIVGVGLLDISRQRNEVNQVEDSSQGGLECLAAQSYKDTASSVASEDADLPNVVHCIFGVVSEGLGSRIVERLGKLSERAISGHMHLFSNTKAAVSTDNVQMVVFEPVEIGVEQLRLGQ